MGAAPVASSLLTARLGQSARPTEGVSSIFGGVKKGDKTAAGVAVRQLRQSGAGWQQPTPH